LGTWKEHVGNKGKMKKKKLRHFLSACWAFSHWLHEISVFQNCSSPFFAWANTPIMNWGYSFIVSCAFYETSSPDLSMWCCAKTIFLS
jgi:hypothetical protein